MNVHVEHNYLHFDTVSLIEISPVFKCNYDSYRTVSSWSACAIEERQLCIIEAAFHASKKWRQTRRKVHDIQIRGSRFLTRDPPSCRRFVPDSLSTSSSTERCFSRSFFSSASDVLFLVRNVVGACLCEIFAAPTLRRRTGWTITSTSRLFRL